MASCFKNIQVCIMIECFEESKYNKFIKTKEYIGFMPPWLRGYSDSLVRNRSRVQIPEAAFNTRV